MSDREVKTSTTIDQFLNDPYLPQAAREHPDLVRIGWNAALASVILPEGRFEIGDRAICQGNPGTILMRPDDASCLLVDVPSMVDPLPKTVELTDQEKEGVDLTLLVEQAFVDFNGPYNKPLIDAIARRLAGRPSVTNVSREAIWWKICQTMPELSESRRQAATDAIFALQLSAPAPGKAADEGVVARLKNYEAILRFIGAPEQIVMGQVSIVHPDESEMEGITREYLASLKGGR